MTSNPQLQADRSFRVIRVSGSDRIEFLQGQLTQDVARATPGTALPAGWASAKGRLIALFWLVGQPEELWLICPTELTDAVVGRLRMFVLRSDVQIDIAEMGVSGFAKTSDTSEIVPLSYCFYDSNQLILAPGLGLDINADGEAEPVSPAWRLAAIRAGLPVVWGETRESFVPQMLNLDLLDGISFSKGCYVGQEIVARTQNLGRIKRRMYRFSCADDAAPAPGESVYAAGKAVGEIVDAAPAESGSELLAVCRIESLGEALSLDADGTHPLKRLDLPYAIPESI